MSSRVLAIVCVTMLSGCTDPVLSMYDDYITRIARVQDVSSLSVPDTIYISLPDKKLLQTPIPRISIGLLESYELRRCGLFELIAERNSSLGKVQDEFHLFDYETRFITGVDKCLNHPDISEEVQRKLSIAHTEKKRHYPLHLQHVITQSDAWRTQLSGKEWLPIKGAFGLTELNLALKPFYNITLQLSETSEDEEHSTLSEHFVTPSQEVIETTNVIGSLSFSLVNSTLWLNQATEQLNQFDGNIRCGEKRDNTQFTYMKNVFQSQYVEKIQPYLSKLDTIYRKLNVELAVILKKTNESYPNFYEIEQHHKGFKSAILSHVKYWQRLFARCGGAPDS
ncbi:DUF3080 family protein [Vibrio penaeicida]|uniref:DUF3080 domain-containing protein n=1 Tax=Vibrio penaeicida TaxID=104609 RepID=A0AAV5NKA5_9VIBR|nr:DUF3080 family protein [Vibrio penaeicida]RTZ23901.1 DUF3080 domain-containing protein [Vibrio penaeicida]GLQ70647.1 hypothetical protein GCM10007932_00070 [Vibrio penaeicida]